MLEGEKTLTTMAYTTFKLHKSESAVCAVPDESIQIPPKRRRPCRLRLTRLLAQLPPNWSAYIMQVAVLPWRGVENSLLLGASANPDHVTLAAFLPGCFFRIRLVFVL